jgi:hypothetical protein
MKLDKLITFRTIDSCLTLHLDFTLIMSIVISEYYSKFCYSQSLEEGTENSIAMPLLGVVMAIGGTACAALL